MAYTVGSASVDIVPDFKNAQLAITAFFERQKNELRIPVKIDLDKQIDSGELERQAANVGSRVSKAMNDGAAKNDAAATKAAIQMARERERALNFAHGEALKIQAAMDREAAKQAKALMDEEVKARLQADREEQRSAAERARALQQAHAEALRMNAQIERDNARRLADEERLADQIVEGRIRAAQRAHAEALRMNAQIDRENARRIANEEKAYKESLRRQISDLREAQRSASRDEKIRLQVEIDERQAILAGRSAGGLVTRAMREELRQSAGLITAVLGGILAFGAPAAIGAAVGLFGAIGAVAAAQSEKVRSTWLGLWNEIKTNSVADAQSLVQPFSLAAGQIGQSFERMRPLVRDAFEATGPYVTSFTSSITQAAENALPGLVHAVQAAGPVVSGLGDLLEKTGTGVGAFFEGLATHSFAAGQAASGLGDVIEQLLPTLAELLGQGAETASIVLPAIAGGFGVVNSVISATGNLLPRILTGFLAFRAVQGIGRTLSNWGASLAQASASGGAFSSQMGRAGSVLSATGRALPIVGIAFAAFAADAARSEQAINDWTQTLLRGGAEAKRLRDLMREFSAGDGFDPSGLVGNSFGEALGEQFGKAEEGARRLYAAMTPLEKAQHDLDVATRNLQKGMEDENTTAGELSRLKAEVASAAARQAREEENLERATKGVTEAMQAQADAARARVDSAFGYQQSLIDTQKAMLAVTQAQTDLDEARASGDPGKIAAAELDLKEALLGVNDALSNQVQLAGEAAMSNLPAAMDETQKSIIGAKAELDELNRIIATGTQLPPELEAYRQQLIAITSGASGAQLAQAQLTAALGEVGVAVEAIPDSAAVKIEAPTEEVKARLEELGFTVTAIPGSKDVRVEAETEEAKGNLGTLSSLLSALGITVAEPTVDLNTAPFAGKSAEVTAGITTLASQRPTPTADLNIGPFAGAHATAMTNSATLNAQRPTPQANLNASAFAGAYASSMAQVQTLHGQRPTPVAGMNAIPFQAAYNNTMAGIATLAAQRPTPVISARDAASGTIAYIQSALAAIRDKTVTVTVQAVNVQNAKAAIEHAGGASGGSVGDVLARGEAGVSRFATGGPTTGAVRYGSGGPWDDMVNIRVSPGEHVFDFGDVMAMGGQDAVYDFRRMLHSGYGFDNAIRQMVTTGAAPRQASAPVQSSTPRSVALYTPDIPAAIRALKAQEHEEAALAPVW